MTRDKFRARAIKIMREAELIAQPERQLVILAYAQCWLRLAADSDENTRRCTATPSRLRQKLECAAFFGGRQHPASGDRHGGAVR